MEKDTIMKAVPAEAMDVEITKNVKKWYKYSFKSYERKARKRNFNVLA